MSADFARRAVVEQSLCAGDAVGNADAARYSFERFQVSGDRSDLFAAIEYLELAQCQLKEAWLRASEAIRAVKSI